MIPARRFLGMSKDLNSARKIEKSSATQLPPGGLATGGLIIRAPSVGSFVSQGLITTEWLSDRSGL